MACIDCMHIRTHVRSTHERCKCSLGSAIYQGIWHTTNLRWWMNRHWKSFDFYELLPPSLSHVNTSGKEESDYSSFSALTYLSSSRANNLYQKACQNCNTRAEVMLKMFNFGIWNVWWVQNIFYIKYMYNVIQFKGDGHQSISLQSIRVCK